MNSIISLIKLAQKVQSKYPDIETKDQEYINYIIDCLKKHPKVVEEVPEIKNLQPISVDGVWGPQTSEAIKVIYKAYGNDYTRSIKDRESLLRAINIYYDACVSSNNAVNFEEKKQNSQAIKKLIAKANQLYESNDFIKSLGLILSISTKGPALMASPYPVGNSGEFYKKYWTDVNKKKYAEFANQLSQELNEVKTEFGDNINKLYGAFLFIKKAESQS